MSTIDWPQNVIPWKPLLDTWALQSQDPVVRTEFSKGPSRSRKRFTNVPSNHTFTVLMSYDQYAYFQGFFESQLNHGAYWFNIPVFTPLGPLTVEAKFIEIPECNGVDHIRFSVPFKLEIRKWPVVSGSLVYILEEYGSSFIDILDKLDPIVNEDSSIPGWPWASRNNLP